MVKIIHDFMDELMNSTHKGNINIKIIVYQTFGLLPYIIKDKLLENKGKLLIDYVSIPKILLIFIGKITQ